MKNKSEILNQAADHVYQVVRQKFFSILLYHNYQHFLDTAIACKEICNYYHLDKEDRENLELAALFHDIGYAKNYQNHEEESEQMAEEFLHSINFPEERIKKISQLILSTKVNRKPESLFEEILHDADYINIGKKEFFEKSQLLRLEWSAILKKEYTDEEWEKLQLEFLLNNSFCTEYALKEYGIQRNRNISSQIKKIERIIGGARKQLIKTDEPRRGVETMFRSTYRNHINLSAIADNKANMMISINTIIMSIVIAIFGSGFTFSQNISYGHFRYVAPVCILLVSSLLAVIFAVLSARPHITYSSSDNNSDKGSLLFFGNFTSLTVDKFVKKMKELTQHKNDLYDNMSVDIYYLGAVLKKKYQLLRISYSIFIIGLVLCVFVFMFFFLRSYER